MEAVFRDEEFLRKFIALVADRLDRVGRHLVGRIREKLSLTGVGFSIVSKWGRRKRQRIYGFARSRPGEPPRKQTGELRRSIAYEVDRDSLICRVGSLLKRAKFLELGTRFMLPRPFLRITVQEEQPNIERIMGGEMPEAA